MKLIDAAERERAARDFSRNLVVTAGAGTGKTSLLIERVLHLVLHRGVRLERIAAITFTKKAAAEMRERLEDALERVLFLASEPEPPVDENEEADRVFVRLRGGGKPLVKVAEACHAALEAIDGASIGTVHSFAGGLLRRHPEEAGVDVGFAEDEGENATELFDELWAKEVESSLGAAEVPEGWRGLLEEVAIDSVEEAARKLVGLNIPIDVMCDAADEDQRACAKGLIELWQGVVCRIRAATAGVKGVNRNLASHLERMEEALDRFDGGDELPCDLADLDLPEKPALGKNAELPGKEELEDELRATLKGVADLAASDPSLARSVSLALRPFVERFRSEHLRRGFVSFDGLIVLARNLLRDHHDIRREEGRRFDHILVDEFQDTDLHQYEIVFFLAEDPGGKGSPAAGAFAARLAPGKLFIVGDAKQSIYHFRGADIRAYARAVEALKREGADVLTLATNFRSVPEIVEPLNELFAATFGSASKTGFDPAFDPLGAHRGAGERAAIEIWSVGGIGMNAGARRDAEANAIARWLHEEIQASRIRPRDVAVLLRSRSEWSTYLSPLRKLGIPYVIQGGKGFYSRLEVEMLIAVLRAVASPADPVALIASLRSPAFAVPDRELQLYAEEHAAERKETRASPWSLRARPEAKAFPELARALDLLRGLAERHAGEPIDRLARAVLEETPLVIAMASMYDGAQRVLNLEKAVRRIASLAGDGKLSGEEILARIEEEDSSDVAGGDSPLADEAHDAVRVLTVHGAKGLEWPVVILPDLARTENPKTQQVEVSVLSGERALLALKVETTTTPAQVASSLDERRHDEAESKRLLYVATTRARNQLILVAGAPTRGRSGWIDALGAWGYAIGKQIPNEKSFRGGRVLHRLEPDPKLPELQRGDDAPDPSLVAAARRFEDASHKAASSARGAFLSPSQHKDERVERDAEGESQRAVAVGGGADRVVATAAGSAIHLLLELWDRKDPAWLFESAEKAVRVAAAGARIDHAPVVARVREILDGAKRSKRLAALAGEKAIAREVPILYLDPSGQRWEGTIDCIAGSPAAPEVVDYKTDAVVSADELARRHGVQLRKYAEAVQRAMGLLVPPDARVEPLRGTL